MKGFSAQRDSNMYRAPTRLKQLLVTSYGHHGCLKSPVTQLIIQQLVQANIKVLYCWSFVGGIHWWPVDSLHNGPVMWKTCPCHDFIMHWGILWQNIIVRRAGLLWSQQDFEWRWSVPLFKCLTVLEFSFILFDLCLLITFFNFIMNYVPIVTFLIFTYHKIWILSIMFCFIWSYWIIYFLACLEVSWRVVS